MLDRQTHFFITSLALAVALVAALTCCEATAAQTLGVMGDSLSDEYAYNGRSYATNWTEQLVNFDGVNLGALGSYPSPRNQGYAFNWALSGATSATVLSGGQASGLAAQIPTAGIDYGMLVIGANDFAPGGSGAAYNNIYNGTWTPTQINSYVNSVVSNISTALNDVLPTGVKMGVATVPDYGITPAVQAAFPDASKRQLVANVVAQVNADIKSTAQADHIVVADLSGLVGATFGPEGSFNTNVLIGNVQIHLNQTTSSNPSQAGFVSDGVHPNTTLQGVLANLFIQALDTGYNAGIPLFTEAQILSHDGLAYGGSDTLNAAIGPYTNFVTSYAPTPPGAGDANNDHVVNGLDISLVSSNWLKVGSNNPGDVNGDGVVNGLDIATISSNWLNTYGGGATAVPEPSTSLLAILGLAIAIAARAGRSRNDQADGLNRTSTQ